MSAACQEVLCSTKQVGVTAVTLEEKHVQNKSSVTSVVTYLQQPVCEFCDIKQNLNFTYDRSLC
jgi:hypothetical protein